MQQSEPARHPRHRKNPRRRILPDDATHEIPRAVNGRAAKRIMCRRLESGCLECVSHIPQTGGYARIMVDREEVLLHRYVYETYVGPIPADMEVHHRCANKLCANHKHMELLTRPEHMRLENELRRNR